MLKVLSEHLACDGLVMRVDASASQGSVMRHRNHLVFLIMLSHLLNVAFNQIIGLAWSKTAKNRLPHERVVMIWPSIWFEVDFIEIPVLLSLFAFV